MHLGGDAAMLDRVIWAGSVAKGEKVESINRGR